MHFDHAGGLAELQRRSGAKDRLRPKPPSVMASGETDGGTIRSSACTTFFARRVSTQCSMTTGRSARGALELARHRHSAMRPAR